MGKSDVRLVCWTAASRSVLDSVVRPILLHPDWEKFPVRFEPVLTSLPEASPGEVVLALGAKALEVIQRHGVLARNRSLTSSRETLLRLTPDVPLLVGDDPDRIAVDETARSRLEWDFYLARRVARTGKIDAELGKYRWVSDFWFLVSKIEKQYEETGEPVEVACDLETMGLDPYAPQKSIVTIGFTTTPGEAHLLYIGPLRAPIEITDANHTAKSVVWLLTSPKVRLRFANGKFDVLWLWVKHGLRPEYFTFDTCLVGSLLSENRSNSLNMHVKTYARDLGGYDDEFNETTDKGRMELVNPTKLLTYAGGDVDGTLRVAREQKAQLIAQPALARFYQRVLHPAARAFEVVERNGVLIDQEKYRALKDRLQSRIGELHREAIKLLPHRLYLKNRDKIELQVKSGKNPLTAKIREEYFFGPTGLNLKPRMMTEKSGKPSTSRVHLQMFQDDPMAKAMCDVLNELDGASKTLSTYVDGFLSHLRSDGRFHPSYMLHRGGFNDNDNDEAGTVTGRLSARDPAIQTLPKHTASGKALRECFIAPEGFEVFEADFSQGELRIAADVAPEDRMIAAYLKGMDLHTITAAAASHMQYEEVVALKTIDSAKYKALRNKGKAGNFGLLYGMSAEGFVDYAWATYGVVFSLEEARDFRQKFLYESWPGLAVYHERQRKYVYQHKKVWSPMGRLRHLPMIDSPDGFTKFKAVRQAINSPIQGALSDMMLMAITRVVEELGNLDLQVAGMIHDSMFGYVRSSRKMELLGQVRKLMSTLDLESLGWRPKLPFPADVSVGPSLAELKELEFA